MQLQVALVLALLLLVALWALQVVPQGGRAQRVQQAQMLMSQSLLQVHPPSLVLLPVLQMDQRHQRLHQVEAGTLMLLVLGCRQQQQQQTDLLQKGMVLLLLLLGWQRWVQRGPGGPQLVSGQRCLQHRC
jgi:hypothetical protein